MYPNKYYITALQLVFICYANSQFISTTGSLQPSSLSKFAFPVSIAENDGQLDETTGSRIFVETFVRVVTESNKLNQVFNIALSTEGMTNVYLQAFTEAMIKVGAEDAFAVAKAVSNGIRNTYHRMSQNVILYATANAVSLFLLTEGMGFLNNDTNAVTFAGAILQNYPANDHPSPLDLVRALSNGINDFLLSTNVYTPSRLPVVPISLARQFYTMTDVAEPITSESEIFSLSVNTELGIQRFTANFLKEFSASPILQSAFSFTGTVYRVSKIWNHVIQTECTRLNSPYFRTKAVANRFSRALSDTFDAKSPTGYAIDFASGYALYVMSQGYLTHSTLLTLPKELARAIDTTLPLNADLFAKINAIVNAFNVLSNNHAELKYTEAQFSTILYYTGSEFYASTKIQRSLSDSAGV